MSKEDNDNSADDYLAQLEWQRTHRRRSSVYYEPKWKYKIVYKNDAGYSSYIPLAIISVAFIFVFVYLLYLIFFKHSFGAIFGLVFFILLITILFFAVRDAESDPKNDSEDDYEN